MPIQSHDPRRYLITYYAALVAVGVMVAIQGPALPTLAQHTHTTASQISMIFSLRAAGYLCGALVSGRILDRFPGHPLMAWAMLLALLTLACIPLAPTLLLLALAVFFMGLADGTLDVSTNSLLTWVYGSKVGPYMNGLHFAFGAGAFLTPMLVAGVWKASGEIHWAYWISALAMLPLLIVFLRLPSPLHPSHTDTQAAAFKAPWKLMALVLLLFFAYGGSEAAFGNWIYSYALASKMASETQAAYLTSVFWGCLTLGRLAGIAVALRVSVNRVLMVDAIGAVVALGLIFLMPRSETALWLGTAGTGLFMASVFPTLLAFAGQRLSPTGRLSGGLTSRLFIGSSLGAILIPWLIGQGFERLGPLSAIVVIFAAMLGMGLVLALLLWPRAQNSYRQ